MEPAPGIGLRDWRCIRQRTFVGGINRRGRNGKTAESSVKRKGAWCARVWRQARAAGVKIKAAGSGAILDNNALFELRSGHFVLQINPWPDIAVGHQLMGRGAANGWLNTLAAHWLELKR